MDKMFQCTIRYHDWDRSHRLSHLAAVTANGMVPSALATSQTLTAMANLLNRYQQQYVTNADYFDQL
jgi:hypothetical protein